MKNLLLVALILGGGAIFFKKCAVTQTKEVAFQGTWVVTDENNLMGQKETVEKDVVSDGKRFRVQSRYESPWGSNQTVDVYDGETLTRKSTLSSPLVNELNDGGSGETVSSNPTPAQLILMKFWVGQLDQIEKAGPGGLVAGRDTVLYQMKLNRPDGAMTGQVWLDAENELVLKMVSSVYSSQVEQTVMTHSMECQKIDYSPVLETAFAKP